MAAIIWQRRYETQAAGDLTGWSSVVNYLAASGLTASAFFSAAASVFLAFVFFAAFFSAGADAGAAAGIAAGLASAAANYTYVSLKLVRTEDSRIVRGYDYALPNDRDVQRLLAVPR